MELIFEHHVSQPREIVFAFHEQPRHLEFALAGWASFRLLQSEDSIAVGTELWFEVNVLGIMPVALGYRNVLYEPPIRFGEELIHGPFSRFGHFHEFDEADDGGTIVRDRIDVAVPWQYGGALALRCFVIPRIRRAFDLRQKVLQRLAADGTIEKAVRSRNGSTTGNGGR